MKTKILFTLLLFNCCSFIVTAQPVQEHGPLQVAGVQLVDSKNQAVVLRGMSFGWSCFHPRFYTKGAVEWLHKDWGCNVVRAAMGIEPKHGYLEDSATNMQLITTVIDAAIEQGIYVIIDWHSHNINLNAANAFFKTMATKYGKYPNVIYEIFNEPDYETWAEVKTYSESIIKTIRSIDPDNIILVGSPHWDQHIHLPAADPIKGYTNLMYTVHYYAATHKQALRDRTSAAIQSGLPIFISESAGMEASGDKALDIDEWQRWIDWAETNKISWVTWSVSDKNETCSVLKKSASATGNWNIKDLKESGIKSRLLYRKYNLGK